MKAADVYHDLNVPRFSCERKGCDHGSRRYRFSYITRNYASIMLMAHLSLFFSVENLLSSPSRKFRRSLVSFRFPRNNCTLERCAQSCLQHAMLAFVFHRRTSASGVRTRTWYVCPSVAGQ